jgi:hypothetical protein
VRGAMVEQVAIGVYGSLVRQLKHAGSDNGAEIVRRVLAQEGRHLKFFTQAAKVVLDLKPRTAAIVRSTTELTWRPPGVDLYGRAVWSKVFSTVIKDPEFVAALPELDRRISEIPGFEGCSIIERYVLKVVDDNDER